MVDLSQLKKGSESKATVDKLVAKHDENYWINVLLYFASFLVGLGIIAEIAYNWDEIPNVVKLIGAVTTLAANACLIIWCVQTKKKILTKVVAFIFAFLIAGVIGLIGQIFQLQANFANGALLWATLSWPIIYFVPFVLWLWLPFFFVGMRFHTTIFHEVMKEFIDGMDDVPYAVEQALGLNNVYIQVMSAICLCGYFIFYTLWVNSKNAANKVVTKPLRFYSGLLLLSIYGSVVGLARIHPVTSASLAVYMRVFVPYMLLAVLIFAINKYKGRTSFMPLFFAGTIFEWLMVTQMKQHWFNREFEQAVPGVFVMLMLFYSYYHKMPRLKVLTTIVALIWAIATFEKDIFDIIPSLMICALFAFFAYKNKSRRGFNVAVMLAVIRILVYYADVENLQYMGFYLIGSGLLIIATILGLTKYAPLLWRKDDEK